MLYAVRWEINADIFMNIVKITGVSVNFHQEQNSWRLLLQSALELINVAEKYEGRLMSSEPPKRNGEFVYFKVIFKNKADFENFLKDVRNKSSY